MFSFGGHQYYALSLDNFMNFLWTYPVANKPEVHSIFLSLWTHIKTQFERELKCFKCDKRREYNNKQFHKFSESNEKYFHFSCSHTPSQNENFVLLTTLSEH